MKKLFLYLGMCMICPVPDAWSAPNACNCDWQVGVTQQYAANCTDSSFINSCTGTITASIVDGVCTPICKSSGGITPTRPTSCAKGTYLNALKTLCLDCPNGGTTVVRGSISITDCYLPSGTTVTDSTGTYTVQGDCYYSK
ncbi:MAG: hypothetical protein NC311_03445 [Muribaculaceae bacterium]|nr:hypothetical protein [Muribaculaceae bacterium]